MRSDAARIPFLVELETIGAERSNAANLAARLVFIVFGWLQTRHFEGDAKIARARVGEDCATCFERQFRRAEDSSHIARKMFDENCGEMRGGVSNGGGN